MAPLAGATRARGGPPATMAGCPRHPGQKSRSHRDFGLATASPSSLSAEIVTRSWTCVPGPVAAPGALLHADLTRRVAGHERPHDRQAEARRRSMSNPSARPTPSSITCSSSAEPSRRSRRSTRPGSPVRSSSRRVGVVDRVLQQLVEHDGERRRHARRRMPPSPRPRSGSGARARSCSAPSSRPAGRCRRTARRPRLRDRISCTRAINGCAAPTPRWPCGPRSVPRRRPWSRSSDEMVWRLFFTRWWISRMVASFERSSRSRRRSSEMSRSSTTAPVTAPWSSSGMPRISTVMSTPPGANSSVTGTPRRTRSHHRLLEAELREAQSLGVGVDAQPVQRRYRVRRRVLGDPARR